MKNSLTFLRPSFSFPKFTDYCIHTYGIHDDSLCVCQIKQESAFLLNDSYKQMSKMTQYFLFLAPKGRKTGFTSFHCSLGKEMHFVNCQAQTAPYPLCLPLPLFSIAHSWSQEPIWAFEYLAKCTGNLHSDQFCGYLYLSRTNSNFYCFLDIREKNCVFILKSF